MLKTITHGAVTEIKVSRTIMRRPVYFNSFYYVDGLLIDTGPPHVAPEVAELIRRLPIETAAITHQHEDHYGNCSLIQNKLGVPIYAHPGTLAVMAAPPKIQLYRKYMWGDAAPAAGLPLTKTIRTNRYCFEVIHTPGHSHDHVSFFEPDQKWLFCGDFYLGEKLTGFMEGEDIADHLSSLEKIIKKEPLLLFCSLKGKLTDAVERLKRKHSYWWNLGVKIRQLYESGLSANQIRRRLLEGELPFYYLSQLNWGRKHLVDSFIKHRELFI
ncbi:MAG: MBL fold metallo-hydrolase [Bacillota bacterium]